MQDFFEIARRQTGVNQSLPKNSPLETQTGTKGGGYTDTWRLNPGLGANDAGRGASDVMPLNIWVGWWVTPISAATIPDPPNETNMR